MMGGKHQNIRVRRGGLPYSHYIMARLSLAVGVRLKGDGISHLFKTLLQVLDGIRFAWKTDGTLGSGKRV